MRELLVTPFLGEAALGYQTRQKELMRVFEEIVHDLIRSLLISILLSRQKLRVITEELAMKPYVCLLIANPGKANTLFSH